MRYWIKRRIMNINLYTFDNLKKFFFPSPSGKEGPRRRLENTDLEGKRHFCALSRPARRHRANHNACKKATAKPSLLRWAPPRPALPGAAFLLLFSFTKIQIIFFLQLPPSNCCSRGHRTRAARKMRKRKDFSAFFPTRFLLYPLVSQNIIICSGISAP